MTLFAVYLLISDQPGIDDLGIAGHRRSPTPRILLARRGHRRDQRLADRPAMHAMSFGQLPDRQFLQTVIAPNLFEQLHSRTHLTEPPCLDNQT